MADAGGGSGHVAHGGNPDWIWIPAFAGMSGKSGQASSPSAFATGTGKSAEPGRTPGTDVIPCFRVTGTDESFSAFAGAPPRPVHASVSGRVSYSLPGVFNPLRFSPFRPDRNCARDGRGGSGLPGLHGFAMDSRAAAGSCLRRLQVIAGPGSVTARTARLPRAIVSRRTSGSWAQDAFPDDGMRQA